MLDKINQWLGVIVQVSLVVLCVYALRLLVHLNPH